MNLHRQPGEESADIYPGLVVSDGRHSRVTGSITIGPSRLPMWAFIGEAIRLGWDEAAGDYYDPGDPAYGSFTDEDAARFLHCLMQHRGEFGRLVLLLADVERREMEGRGAPWYRTKRNRKRMVDQLTRCLAALEREESC